MAVEQLSFQGINRAASDFSNGGACEEMINLRPTGTGLVPVKPFSVKMHGVAYDKLYIHKAGAVTNYIAVKQDNSTLYIYHVSEDGIVLATIATVDVTGKTNFSVSQVHFAYTGNIILFSICDKADNFYMNLSYLWDGESYKENEANIPNINASFISETPEEFLGQPHASYAGSATYETIYNTAWTYICEENKEYCFGSILVAIVFRTKDGQTFCTNRWMFYDITKTINTVQDWWNSQVEGYIHPTIIFSEDDSLFAERLYGLKLGMSLYLNGAWNVDTSTLKSVEVYSSIPEIYPDKKYEYSVEIESSYLKPRVFTEFELDNKLLYLQKSIPMEDLNGATSQSPYTFYFEFGGNIQATNKTLEVDAGPTTRYGNLLAYNARFHYFNSVARIDVGMPEFMFIEDNGSTASTDVFVTYNDGESDITAYIGSKTLPSASNGMANMVIARHSKVKSVITQYYDGNYFWVAEYPMDESKRYNYSIYVSNESSTVSRWQIPIFIPSNYLDVIIKNEPEAINVTEQYNPFVFKVEHSYLAPGAVLDIQPQMVAVKDVTYGDYPLNVFTNRGLYALLQGNGVVLYGAFRSISNLITTANAIPTEMGTFFLAADGMWLIAGDTVVLVSDALSRGPHKFVRDATGYYDICHDTYDVTQYVSAVSFEEFTKETAFSSAARLVYNRYRDELMVCNPDYDYCYVLSLKYRQWFKMAETYSQDAVGEIAFSGFSVSGQVVSEDSPAPYHTITVSFTIGGNTFTCDHYVADRERNARAIADALTSDCREAFAGTILSEISFVAALDASSNFRLSAILPKTIDDPQAVTASLFKIVNRAEETIFEGSFLFAIGRNVVSFEDEDELAHSILVHLQTRPFSIGYQYIHIHRIVAMIRARLASGHLIVNALYGSDDLQNWTLISYASRQNAQISQIRTPSAARSWRYYTVCIGGHVHWDTDLGTVLFDYQPVVRRIG